MAHTEYEEARALRMISRGQGLWPLKSTSSTPTTPGVESDYDEAYVTFDLEEPDLVVVYFRKNGEPQAMYSFRLKPHAHLEKMIDEDEDDEEGGECECCGGDIDADPHPVDEDNIPPHDDVDWGPNDIDADAGTQGELGF